LSTQPSKYILPKIHRPKPSVLGPRLPFFTSPRFDNLIKKWVIPFMGSDSAVVRMGQEITESLRLKQSQQTSGGVVLKRPVDVLHPVQFQAYMSLKNLWYLSGAVIFGTVLSTFAKFPWTRSLLLRFPGFFSFGVFSRNGPTVKQMEETSVSSTFVGRGYKRVVEGGHGVDGEGVVGKHEVEIVTRVSGPGKFLFFIYLFVNVLQS
jgi:hypothetical protein